jgi:hypothetical protein
MRRACSTHGKDKKLIKILVAKSEGKRFPGGFRNIRENKIKWVLNK